MQNLRRSYPQSQRRVSRLCLESNDTTDRLSRKMPTSRIVTEKETEFGSPKGTILELFSPISYHVCHRLSSPLDQTRNVISKPAELFQRPDVLTLHEGCRKLPLKTVRQT
jgi:hypothetical protein